MIDETDITLIVVIILAAERMLKFYAKLFDRCSERSGGILRCKSGCCSLETGDSTPGSSGRTPPRHLPVMTSDPSLDISPTPAGRPAFMEPTEVKLEEAKRVARELMDSAV